MTSNVTPEMPRPLAIARIGKAMSYDVVATEAERRALAIRMGVPAIHSLRCAFELTPEGDDVIRAAGALRAALRQVCVVTLEPFDTEIAEDFRVRFVPAGTESEEIDLEADDEIGYENGVVDLGEAASEQLALAMDPFPRKPGVELPAEAGGPATGAFAALASLRRAPVKRQN
jgi:uncharacterized metal-binding protein YceD (DUF177 family)